MKYVVIEAMLLVLLLALAILLYKFDAIMEYAKGEKFMNNIFSSKVYDWLKWIAIVCLPALSTFTVVLGQIYHFENTAGMIAQTITAVATLIGALLGISHIQYKNGENNADN